MGDLQGDPRPAERRGPKTRSRPRLDRLRYSSRLVNSVQACGPQGAADAPDHVTRRSPRQEKTCCGGGDDRPNPGF